ncbi:hypothetical protein Dsin_001483, partial [Dipteronia sinensis]
SLSSPTATSCHRRNSEAGPIAGHHSSSPDRSVVAASLSPLVAARSTTSSSEEAPSRSRQLSPRSAEDRR